MLSTLFFSTILTFISVTLSIYPDYFIRYPKQYFYHPSISSALPASVDVTSFQLQTEVALRPGAPCSFVELNSEALPLLLCCSEGREKERPPSSLAPAVSFSAAQAETEAGVQFSPRRKKTEYWWDQLEVSCLWEDLKALGSQLVSWLAPGFPRQLQERHFPLSGCAWRGKAWLSPVELRGAGETLAQSAAATQWSTSKQFLFLPLSMTGSLIALFVSASGLFTICLFAAFGLSAIFFWRFSLRARVRSNSFCLTKNSKNIDKHLLYTLRDRQDENIACAMSRWLQSNPRLFSLSTTLIWIIILFNLCMYFIGCLAVIPLWRYET